MGNDAFSKLSAYGIQSQIAMRTKIARTTVVAIFNGKRRATPPQAALLEQEFIRKGIPLNRWDLLYGVNVEEGETLPDYLQHKDEARSND